MAITSIRIHPAIGIARVGNSPDEFFIGPERSWERPDPPGGFKDNQCRVKRQAARFRIFATTDANVVSEITADEAEISWTVHIANRKAVTRNPGSSAADMTIDPGPRTLNGPDQRELFDNGKIKFPGVDTVVPLGEARTDDQARLIVLGGFGHSASPTGAPLITLFDNPEWHDDVADGPVTAKVKLIATGEEFEAAGAWVIVGPPKFAPGLDNVVTLYDALFQFGIDQGWPLSVPTTPSYTNDIYPVLHRARGTKWLQNVGVAHSWPDPVYDAGQRTAIFNKLKYPDLSGGGNMPALAGATLTPTQYLLMERWKDGSFVQDWAGPPQPPGTVSPADMDRAALENCVGAAFAPGIEAGGTFAGKPIVNAANYVGPGDPFRINHGALPPGGLTEFMSLPWQTDFHACGHSWWPVPRPNDVFPQAGGPSQAWDRDVNDTTEMVTEWSSLGFVVRQGDQYVEVDRCDTAFIALLTPHLDFQDVPQGPMGAARKAVLAITFEVRSPGGPVTLEVKPGDGFSNMRLTLDQPSVTVGPTPGDSIATARLWVIYQTGPVGEFISDSATVTEPASGKTWTVTVEASTVARKTAAVALVLDRSGSMSEDRGDGVSKHQSLVQASSIFLELMLEGDAVGIARYNEEAQQLQGVTALGAAGDPFDPGRQATLNQINGAGLNPSGATSIGDGIFEGRQLLNTAPGNPDVKALVVLTDGNENTSRWISDVAGEINEQTYAIGLGKPENTSAAALQTISGNNGGYLLVTGPIAGDNRFVLQKYFLQILAGIVNAETVLDPDGVLVRGREQRIPFQLTEADTGVEVILLTPFPEAIDFRLQAPNGVIIEPWRALAEAQAEFRLAPDVTFYRVALPIELAPGRFSQEGTWHALLRIGKPRLMQPRSAGPGGTAVPGAAAPLGRFATGPTFAAPALSRVVRPDEIGRTPLPNQEHVAIGRRANRGLAGTMAASSGREQRGLPFSLMVHTYSDLTLRSSLTQSGFVPGAKVVIEATLAESGLPVRRSAGVWAEVASPGGASFRVELNEHEPGRFEGAFTASRAGVYACRIRASGRSRNGYPFHREQTRTAAVWFGGDRDPVPPGAGRDNEQDERLCRLLACMLAEGVVGPELERRLQALGVDLKRLRTCLAEFCKADRAAAREDRPR